jgi:hypothetical protein
MAKDHLTRIKNAIVQVEKLKAEVEKVREQLQTEYDELPFETQDSDYGEELQSAMDALESALYDGLDIAEDELHCVRVNLEMLPMCDRGLDDMENEEEDFEDDYSASLAAGAIYLGLKAGGKEEKKPNNEPLYDYHDTHWETSFDWKDEDNDGYDDRDDGFWTP